MHGLFLFLGLISIACVLLVTIYLLIAGVPAFSKIGVLSFLFGTRWAPTASNPSYGILPFILTSVYGTILALLISVPVGILSSIYLCRMVSEPVRKFADFIISLLAGIPSVIFGLCGMILLVPAIKAVFHVPDGSGLLAAVLILAIMILPNIIKVSSTAIQAVDKDYEKGSLALGASKTETWFRITLPAAKQGIAAAVVLAAGRAIGEAMAVMMVSGNAPNMPSLFESVRFLTTAVASEMAYASGLQREALFSIALVLFVFIMLINGVLGMIFRKGKKA